MLVRTFKLGGTLAAMLALSAAALASQPAVEPSLGEVIAKVNDEVIKRDEFEAAVVRSARQRFYHGKVEEAKLVELKREVLEDLVIEKLLLKEAVRRNIQPDQAEVEAKIAALDERYKDAEQWAAQRDEVLPEMRSRMLANSQKALLEQHVRKVAAPSDAELKQFYENNKDLFTEPQRDRVAVILLKVDPSSTRDVWASAMDEAARLRAKIVAGGSFADLAKLHSGDESGKDGGDMGYLHRGMLAPEAEAALDKLEIGAVSEPVELLQGYALFKLLDRTKPNLRSLDQVRERAADLYLRKKADEAWTVLTADLRKKAKVWIDPKVASSQ